MEKELEIEQYYTGRFLVGWSSMPVYDKSF
jgi:hypothetical protein